MAGFVVERHGYTTAGDMLKDIITDMLANGFTQVLPQGATAFNKATITFPFQVTMEAGPLVDPLNDSALAVKQPWRVMFDTRVTSGATASEFIGCYVASPLQLDGKGALADRKQPGSTPYYFDIIGAIGAQMGTETSNSAVAVDGDYAKYQGPTSASAGDETTKGLINRGIRVAKNGNAYPLSYRLAITGRGFWLGTWEDASTAETAINFNWVLVQRPVDRTTGATLVTGKAPVFCVNGVGGNYWQFVVRESDILKPGQRRTAETNTNDSEAIINGENQVSLSEDGKYIVTFPSRLNTSRYRYPHELDMIGITSADVVSQFSDVPLTVYGEGAARSYKAMHANSPSNTGMRVIVLQAGGGIS